MALRDGPLQERRAPLIWLGAGATIVAAVIALFLLLADRRDHIGPGGYGGARNEFDELIEPVANVLSTPVRWFADASTEVKGYFFAVSENRRLRERVKELERWRDAAVALKNVNTQYEALLRMRTEPPIPTIAARVVSDARGPFSNARLADAGSGTGVRPGDPVMSEHGLVGRIVGVSSNASRILLLTDTESRTPVLIDRNDARSILTGDGGAVPRLEYLRGQDVVKEGDLVLTSGDGGVYPRGLPVGVATRDIRGGWRVRLYADRQAIDYVRILDYQDFGKLADLKAVSDKELPPLNAAQQADLQGRLTALEAPPPPPAAPPASAAAAPSASTTPHASTAAAATATPRVAASAPSAHPREGAAAVLHRAQAGTAPSVAHPKPAGAPKAAGKAGAGPRVREAERSGEAKAAARPKPHIAKKVPPTASARRALATGVMKPIPDTGGR